MCISVNNDFAALQYGQENHLVFVFSLWYLAPRSLALEVFKSPILLLLHNNYYSTLSSTSPPLGVLTTHLEINNKTWYALMTWNPDEGGWAFLVSNC